jgi:DNA-binding response OmpR family regulator
VRNVLRRTRGPVRQEAGKVDTTVRFVGWQLDLATRRLVAPNGKEVALRTGELDLLAVFAQHPIIWTKIVLSGVNSGPSSLSLGSHRWKVNPLAF